MSFFPALAMMLVFGVTGISKTPALEAVFIALMTGTAISFFTAAAIQKKKK